MMKNKILIFVLCFLFVFSLFSFVQAETVIVNGEEVNENEKYIFRTVKNEWNEEKNCYIVGYNIFNKGRLASWFILFN